jgi:rhodanese-related sulfurtransferase
VPIIVSCLATIPHITTNTFLRIIQGEFYDTFEALVVLDCRFEHEFAAGHVQGAFNLTNLEELRELYDHFLGHQVCFVFHCEFSQNRGPTWAQIFREFDRIRNHKAGRGFRLCHPCAYIVHGGYEAISAAIPQVTIGSYKRMMDITTDVEHKSLTESHANFKYQARRAGDHDTFWAFADPDCSSRRIQKEIVNGSLSQPNDWQISVPEF